MKICVLDLELNKPSKKIIEIGAVCLNLKTGVIEENQFQIYIDPQEPIDPFITQLTGITQVDVDGESSLKDGLIKLNNWMTTLGCQKFVSAWGSDWHTVFQAFKEQGVLFDYPKHLDIKSMATILRCAYPSNKSKGGLLNTMELFGLKFDGEQHRALNDAFNTAKLLNHFKSIVANYNQIVEVVNK